MTDTVPTEAERIEKMEAAALTERQIDASIRMWRDPDNWRLVPTRVGKRNLYVRKSR